ncbi:hypothetical protein KKC91_03010 [bacterium]|nr:hypothetical protein [bacterium]
MAKTFNEQIDDYKDSIFAIIGFINLFRFDDDTQTIDNDIMIFQGRRMKTSSANRVSPDTEVTPDFCIQAPNNKGIVGEIKKSFPEENSLWMKDFEQLMRYDDELTNWLTTSGKIDNHEIVLLPEQSRSRAVQQYFEERKDSEITFNKNFIIVQFNRNDQVKSYFFFRKEYGSFKYFDKINKKLLVGVMVPTDILMLKYEKIKLYDAKPPLPYLLHLIWENVIMFRASDNEKFSGMKRIPINITIENVVEDLHANYSFKKLNAGDDTHQPKIPLTSWVKEALNAMVTFKLAVLIDSQKGEYTVNFKKFKKTLETFIDLCTKHELGNKPDKKQGKLFNDIEEPLDL